LDGFSLESFKQDIKVLAVAEHWRPAQIQYAEDYIDALVARGTDAPLQGLDPEYAQVIKELYQLAID